MQKIIFSAYRFVIVPMLIAVIMCLAAISGKWLSDHFASNIVEMVSKLPFWSDVTGVLTYFLPGELFTCTALLWLILYRVNMDDTSAIAWGIARLWKRIVWSAICKRVIAILVCYSIVSMIVTTILYSLPHVERFEPFLSIAYNIESYAKWACVLLFVLLSVSSNKGDK